MQLIQSKSILAKLMATENLIVEERKCSTASFDVKNRILTIPILDKTLSSNLYDLFTGHEVGHAIYTPLEGFKKVIEEKIINPGILNIVEDARIEKKIQSKYPGLKSSFLKAYNELLEQDFFETKGKDLNQLNFIDRVNLHCKGGAGLLIKFNEEEKELLNAIQGTETYPEVVEVAKRVQEFMKLKAEEKHQEKLKAKKFVEMQQSEESDDFENSESDDFEDSESDDKDYYPDDEETQEEVKSHTDEAFQRNQNRLLDQKSRNLTYINIPNVESKNVILDFKELYSKFLADQGTVDNIGFQKLRKESEKVVSYLVKEFEMRKNAEQMKRSSIAKTGDLNMSKIYSYNFSEDLFKRITVVPNGKSHGLVMFIDWSGSMSDHLKNTVKQLFNLILFCRKVSIPYEVYAFSDSLSDHPSGKKTTDEPHNYEVTPKNGDLKLGHFRLLNLFSSRMGSSDFLTACGALCSFCNFANLSFDENPRSIPRWFDLGSTPLNETIIAAMNIVPEFREKYKLQKVHTIFLTDGEANQTDFLWGDLTDEYSTLTLASTKQISIYEGAVIRDPVTRNQIYLKTTRRDEITKGLVQLLKMRTDSTVIGYYLLSSKEFKRKGSMFFTNSSLEDIALTDFRKNKFSVVKNAGYDEYYLLKSEASSIYRSRYQSQTPVNDIIDDETFEVAENATRRGIVSAFAKYNTNKMTNRVILNRFINLIA
jgi:hypothetical protein